MTKQSKILEQRSKIVAIVALAMTMLAGRSTTAADSCAQTPMKRARFLVLDSRIIETAENAELTLGKTEKSEHNPLMAEDKPWEKRFDNLHANVIYDEEDQLYKCWYSPFIVDHSASGMTLQQRRKTPYRLPRDREMAVCYAVSKDGTKWEKPELGLVDFEGSKQNNIVWRGPHGASVFKDLRDPDPARRYKMLFKGRAKPGRLFEFAPGQRILCVASSADGIHWGKAIPCLETGVQGDTHNNAFWAPTLGKYVGISRISSNGERLVARTESDDFLKWTQGKVVFRGVAQQYGPGRKRRLTGPAILAR